MCVQLRELQPALETPFAFAYFVSVSSTLVESLVLISNEFGNYATQSAFVKSVSEPVCVQLRELQPALETPFAFAEFVGLTKPAGAGEAGPQHQGRNPSAWQIGIV